MDGIYRNMVRVNDNNKFTNSVVPAVNDLIIINNLPPNLNVFPPQNQSQLNNAGSYFK